MTDSRPSPILYRFAIVEVLLAVLTVIFGALTTSKNAGMAFLDWPTSDGHFMVSYPWFRDFAHNWGKFLEHGHRLAGMVVGIWSIVLVVTAFVRRERSIFRILTTLILVCVICQGLLGGFRVQLNDRGLAMLHGIFASIVFSLMGTLVAVSNPMWSKLDEIRTDDRLNALKISSTLCVILMLIQYLYGSLVRHQGTGLHEHLGLGFIAMFAVIANTVIAYRQSSKWLRWSALMLFLITITQVPLGLTTWVLKFGFPHWDYVAVADSIRAVLVRTTHMVWGALLLMVAWVNVLKVYRVAGAQRVAGSNDPNLQKTRNDKLSSGEVL